MELGMGLFFLLTSIIFFLKNRINTAVFLLFLAALSFFIFASLLDPFLNLWDERFHALVAKNLMNHPLRPTLYDDPVIGMGYDRWDRSLIWLHKQPLFLWQIAVSYKIFGVNEFAVRFPSALLSALMIPVSYRTGSILVNRNTGYLTAFIVTVSYYLFELVSGKKMVDHNDVVFFFYVSASIWAWVEYIRSGKIIWLIGTGVFSGFAVLTKWLVGLAVYSGWLLYLVMGKKERSGLKAWFHFTMALILTLLIILPWQFWIFRSYPEEALCAFRYNSDHFLKVIEGHGGPWWYYLVNMRDMFGFFAVIAIPLGLIFLFRNIRLGMNVKIAFLFLPVLVFVFFSLAKTKMPSFPFVISLPVFIGMACILDYLIKMILKARLPSVIHQGLIFLLLVLVFFLNFRPFEIFRNHSAEGNDGACNKIQILNKKIFLHYRELLPPKTVLFNLKGRSYVECMFYSGFTAYNFLPTIDQYREVKNKGYQVAVVNFNKLNSPDFLKHDSSLIILNDKVFSCD